MLNSQDSLPLYLQLKEDISQNIASGRFPRGSKIPTELELSDTYNVSRITVRKALGELADEGVLERRQGKGTYVSAIKLQRSIRNFMGFSETCAAQGLKYNTKVIKSVIEDATDEDQRELHLPEGSKVIVLERIMYADNIPVAIDIDRFTEEYGYLLGEELTDVSLFSLFQKRGISFQSHLKVLELTFANYEMSKYLDIPQNYPLLMIHGNVSDQNSVLAYRNYIYIVGDKFKFYV